MIRANLAPLSVLPPRTLETPRLLLRAIEPNDGATIFKLYAADPVASRYMSFKCTGKLSDTQYFVDNAARYFRGEESPVAHYPWLITVRELGEEIGTVGIGPKSEFTLAGGYILAPQYWGHGYATEAWGAIVEWAKTQPGVHRIEASHHPSNAGSGRVMEKVGLTLEGVIKRSTLYPNVSDLPEDAVLYAWTR